MAFRALKLCLLLCVLTLTLGVSAQSNHVYNRSTETTFYGRLVDSLTKEPLPSAVISVVSEEPSGRNVVRNYVTNEKGDFQFTSPYGVRHRMEIASLGYKPHTIDLVLEGGNQNLGHIRLSQSTEAIDEVVVKARLQMYKMKGDTILYLPRAVKTMTDDPALEILRHMPGVEVNDGGGIKILGQPVERTYVNNKLLFGYNPTTALKELDAKEIASIEAYDEVDEVDAVANGENARKRKVLNVVTFKEFTQSISGKARGEMGTDFHDNADGERPVRYLASANVDFYSEALQLSARGESSNTPKGGRGLLYASQRQSHAGANVSGSSGAHRYNADYSYLGDINTQRSASSGDLFPTDYFTSQHNEDTMHRKRDSDSHYFSGGYGYTGERFSVSTSLRASLTNADNLQQATQHIVRDGAALSSSDINDITRQTPRSLRWEGSASRRFKSGNSAFINTSFDLESRLSRGARQERRTTEGVETPLEWDTYSRSPDNKIGVTGGYRLDFGKEGNLSFGSGVDYAGNTNQLFYTDLLTGVQDLARSENAFDKTIDWNVQSNYHLRGESFSLLADLKYTLDNRIYEDIKAGSTDRRNFHFVTGNIAYNLYKPKKNFRIQVDNAYTPVNVRDFSSRINDTSPLYVSTGNRSLVPKKRYSLSFDSEFLGEIASYGFSTQIGAEVDPIIYRRTFFKEATTLPQYDNYLMSAGSTLTTPENGASHLRFSAKATYKVRITPLRLFLDFDVLYSFSNPKESLYDRTERTAHHQMSLYTRITTNFSSYFRIKVNNRAEALLMQRFGNSSRELRDVLEVNMEWDILKSLNLEADYTGIFNITSGMIPTPTTHLLNLSLGYRILKERGRIAFNAYDVLNDYSPIRISQSLEGISTSVADIGANYFTLSFEYKFNNRRTEQ